jgi:lipoyl(octanoyl) transferase
MEIEYVDWGKVDYGKALKWQTEKFDRKVKEKLEGGKDIKQEFVVCEHNNVYTIGLHGKDSNLLINDKMLEKIGARVYHINRGGDITYHGEGQITGYPLLDIEALGLGIREYIDLVEEMIINVIGRYGIKGERLKGATGVWIDPFDRARKICAIGVKASRGVTMHGFALNVNTDLKYFSYINPCGFVDKGVTSIEKEIGEKVNIGTVKEELYREFVREVEKRIDNK